MIRGHLSYTRVSTTSKDATPDYDAIGVIVRTDDFVTSDINERYIVSSAERTALGLRLLAELQEV